jgi:SAM-dependent methyltransferase
LTTPTEDKCPVCVSTRCFEFLTLPGLPVIVGDLCPSEGAARRAVMGDFRLLFCESCSHVWNGAYEAQKLDYLPGYEISLHFSPVYQEFLARLAQNLIEAYHLHGKTVLEIACGTGHFLRMLCHGGGNRGIGIDPALKQDGTEALEGTEIAFHRDKFSERYIGLACDFIFCRQALHMVTQPRDLIELVRRTIGDGRSTPIYFEVVNARKLFAKQSVWQLIYEHYSFFTAASLARLFSECGFETLRVGPCYEDGQYLSIEARPTPVSSTERQAPDEGHAALRADVLDFASAVRAKMDTWEQRLRTISAAGQRAIVWGAGGRGINFLNLIEASGFIRHIVDINPDRQGGYIPGSGQRIVGPAFLQDYRPDLVLLTNPTYEQEVRQQVADLGVTCEFLMVS